MPEPGYRPYGWEQWPDFPWWSYQFRRVLGETREGGGAISECFLAADAMRPGDGESWFLEWKRLADRSAAEAAAAEAARHVVTARNAYLRATDYYRASEYGLAPFDPRRLESFDKCEECFQKAGRHMTPPLESVRIPYEGTTLPAYFLPPSDLGARWPVPVSFGGQEEARLAFETAKSAGVTVASMVVSPQQTTAEHCQLDNPSLGEDLVFDWLADVFCSKPIA